MRVGRTLALALVLGAAGAAQGAQETKTLVPPSSGAGGESVVAGYAGSYALVVGMSDYAPGTGWGDLESVPGEVARVEGALRAQGFAVVTHLDPDAETLEKAFEDFIENHGYDEDHRLLFYVSGHGYTLAGAGGRERGFLVPTDAPNPLRDAPGFRRKALSMAQIVTWAREMTARHALFLFDSCFSGTVFRTRALPDEPPHIDRLANEPVRQFITAGSANEEVPARSVFTPAFVDALEHREGDLNEDGYVTGMELGMHLQEKVPRHTEQTPQFGKIQDYELSRGDFVFRVGQSGPPPPPPGDAARAYEAAERVHTVAAYRHIVESFPGSIYAKLAAEQIAKLEGRLVVAGGDGDGDGVPPTGPAEVEDKLSLDLQARVAVQRGLSSLGQDAGPADGVFGERTRKALRAWQGSKGLKETGYLTEVQAEGLIALGRDVEREERLRAERERKAREEAARRAREERKRADDEAFARAEAKGTAAAYAEYRKLYPEGRHAEEAERRERERTAGRRFRDCAECPELVVVPSGSYMMGSSSGEDGRDDNEGPVHRVRIGRPFAVGVYEVTFGEWDACVSDKGCGGYRPDDQGGGRGRRPVMGVNWDDAKAYVGWLSRKTGEEYRLLSESEWEYVARGGTETARYWGESESGQCRYANGLDASTNYDGRIGCDDGYYGTAPVGRYEANGFGLRDVLGNILEWVEDCWNGSYAGAPTDGSAWESGYCDMRVVRGGSWRHLPRWLRSAFRARNSSGARGDHLGFRVARTLTP